ncbi:glxK [Symbiodinium microadriaticum]|nr:glxK [Symbiodinium microadriaticum]
MKKKLILVRHAQAASPESGDDFGRKLTALGERAARHLGRWLAQEFKTINAIISSTAVRATTTAEILSEELKAPGILDFEEELYEASVRTMLNVIHSADSNHEVVIIVGHNPTISYIADFLTSDPTDNMPPCTAVGISFDGKSWEEIDQNDGKVIFFRIPEEADIVIVPVPWEATVSYRSGTAGGPEAILKESSQLDFMVHGVETPWKVKSVLMNPDPKLSEKGIQARALAKSVIGELEQGKNPDATIVQKVNQLGEELLNSVCKQSRALLKEGKIAATLGGDHSTPLGLLKALSENETFGILQIDAHMDLRDSYEGFEHSHASIMFNALKLDGVATLTQVGVRDYAAVEVEFAEQCEKNIAVFYDDVLKARQFDGENWSGIIAEIVDTLPDNVYVSFDIDGLEPSCCPNTGTPVMGGLSFNEAMYLIEAVVRSGRKIAIEVVMKILIAPNAFKGSLSALEAGHAILKGLEQSKLDFDATMIPIADGGDGSLEIIARHLNCQLHTLSVRDPLGNIVDARVGANQSTKQGVVELAEASGIRLVSQLDPFQATTFGTGQLLNHLFDSGCTEIFLGIGGSATVDGGIGILEALGMEFFKGDQRIENVDMLSILQVDRINPLPVSEKCAGMQINILSDVENPLMGSGGAVAVFGPQKGIKSNDQAHFNNALQHWKDLLQPLTSLDLATFPGGGASGGVAVGLMAVVPSKLVSGGREILEMSGFFEELTSCQLLITAEGKIDAQTAFGKGPGLAASLAKEKGITTLGLCGLVGEDYHSEGSVFDAVLSINPRMDDLEKMIRDTEKNLTEISRQLGKLLAIQGGQE